MIDELTKQILVLISTGSLGALAIFLVCINKKVASWFMEKIWYNISETYRHKRLRRSEIAKDTKIREILIELRTLVNADRACLFQFHNGSVFTTKNPIWKMSNTHESVAPGTSSEIGNLQDIKASCLIETLQAFWSETTLPVGIETISPSYCGECTTSCGKEGRKVIFIDVKRLEDSYSKSLLIEQGIKYVLDVPIHNGDNNCVGFVSVNYCHEGLDAEIIKKYAKAICRNASQVRFTLLS